MNKRKINDDEYRIRWDYKNKKWLNELTEKNETLKNKVKHLEQMIEILDTVCKTYEPNFESFDHKTIRNENGNLITYHTK